VNYDRFLFSHVNFTTFRIPGDDHHHLPDLEIALVKDAVRVLQLASARDANGSCEGECTTWSDPTLRSTLMKVTGIRAGM